MTAMHDQDQIKADAANAAKFTCPETGRDLSQYTGDAIRAYAAQIFPHGEEDLHTEYRDYARRYRLLLRMADQADQAGRVEPSARRA